MRDFVQQSVLNLCFLYKIFFCIFIQLFSYSSITFLEIYLIEAN
jgi:hypothetical protein